MFLWLFPRVFAQESSLAFALGFQKPPLQEASLLLSALNQEEASVLQGGVPLFPFLDAFQLSLHHDAEVKELKGTSDHYWPSVFLL